MTTPTVDGLGQDLSVVDGDLAIGGNGDYSMLSGSANLSQALGLLLATNQGQYVWDPAYGANLGQFADENQNAQIVAQEVSQASGAAMSDPRVSQVVSCTVKQDTAQPDAIDVSLVVATASGQIVTAGAVIT